MPLAERDGLWLCCSVCCVVLRFSVHRSPGGCRSAVSERDCSSARGFIVMREIAGLRLIMCGG